MTSDGAARAVLPLAVGAVILAGCGGPAGRERMGDRAYGQARWSEALADYRAAARRTPNAELWAKLGAAALHAGELREAAEAYVHVAEADPRRRSEAAEGLDGVGRAAERAGTVEVLRKVMAGLRAVAPDRPTGGYALLLSQQAEVDSTELVAVLPGALAAASAPETVDSLLTVYGRALEVTAGCGQALLQYRAVLRRSQDSSMRATARRDAAGCALELGQRADSSGRLQDAALWYAESARMDSSSATGREALFRYGAARLAQGDTLAAALAFQAIAAQQATDSTGEAAASRLAALGWTPSAGDSARTGDR